MVSGRSTGALEGLPAPDQVFIGEAAEGFPEILAAVLRKNPCVGGDHSHFSGNSGRGEGLYGKDPAPGRDVVQVSVSRARKAGNYHLMTRLNRYGSLVLPVTRRNNEHKTSKNHDRGAGAAQGKTMLTCALLAAWKEKGLRLISYKCGPDYIDPMFHREALGVGSANLDTFLCGKDYIRRRLLKNAKKAELAVLEGVMGYYDGIGGISDGASSYEVADVTRNT